MGVQLVRYLNKLRRESPKLLVRGPLFRIATKTEEPREHANDIPVDHGMRLVEGNAADRAGRVAANPGQREDRLKILRKFSAMPGRNQFCGAMQIPRT